MTSFYDAFNKPERPTPAPHTVSIGEPYAVAALDQEIENVATAANGTRNHKLNIASFNLGQLVAAGALHEGNVRENLTAAAQTCGLDDAEIIATLNSGMRAGMQKPRTIPERSTPEVAALTVLDTSEGVHVSDVAQKVRDRLPIIDWAKLWDEEDDEEWILEPILPARRLVALYSPPKVGKSLLMLEIAVAVSRGTPCLGSTPDKARRVLYVDFENDPRGDIRERLQAMRIKPADLDNLCYLSFPTMGHLDTEAGSVELLAAAEVYDCEVIIIDTVSRSVGGDENENDTWLNFYRYTGLKLKQAKKALIRLDHTGKDETKGQRGGSAKVGDVDAVWKMSKVTDTTFRLDCEANRMPIAEKTLVLHREQGPLRHRVDPYGRQAANTAKEEALLKAIAELDLPVDISVNDAGQLLRQAGYRASRNTLSKVLKNRRFPFRNDIGTAPENDRSETLPERDRNGD